MFESVKLSYPSQSFQIRQNISPRYSILQTECPPAHLRIPLAKFNGNAEYFRESARVLTGNRRIYDDRKPIFVAI